MEIDLPKLAANAIKEFVAQKYIHEELPTAEIDLEARSLQQLHLKVQGALRPIQDFKLNLGVRISGIESIVKGAENIETAEDYHRRDTVSGIDHYLPLYQLMSVYIDETTKQVNIPDQRGNISLYSYLSAVLTALAYNWLRKHNRNGLREYLKYEERSLCIIGWGPNSYTKNELTNVSNKIYDLVGIRKGF